MAGYQHLKRLVSKTHGFIAARLVAMGGNPE